MAWLQSLVAELRITMLDGTVWLSIAQGLILGAVCLVVGIWVARLVGLLGSDAPAGETIGVGLAAGLLVLTSGWAALVSGGRSSFTPVALGFAVAIGLAVVRRTRRVEDPEVASSAADGSEPSPKPARRSLLVAILGGGVFVIAAALLYGATMAPSPRRGVQPVEFMDEAYYAILGADLAKTGTETIYSPSGFTDVAGLPPQTWYHWGGGWLVAAAITAFGTEPLDARHLIVLPILLLALAALTGTLVRRLTGSESRGLFLFGFAACLFLAPIALIPGGHFSSWAVGTVFGVTMYDVAAVAVLLAMYGLAVLSQRQATWALAIFAGTAAATILVAHIGIAGLALVGLGSVWAIEVGRSLLATRRLPVVTPIWRQTIVASAVVLVATAAWGLVTEHGIGASGLATTVTPFNASWREALAITTLGAGAFFAIAVEWFFVRKDRSVQAGLYLGTMILVVAGALIWGARLGDFNSFHLFFGGIAVFATPVAAVAAGAIWLRLRATGHARLAVALAVLVCLQLGLGVASAVTRLQVFGPHTYRPTPVAILDAIEELPPDAKLAYACQPADKEVAFWDARLLGLAAHTDRRIVPMCFESESFGPLTGAPISPDVANPLFLSAPQRALYPDSSSRPSPEAVTTFLKANGIDYIYADKAHPNTLVPDAIPILTVGDTRVLRLP